MATPYGICGFCGELIGTAVHRCASPRATPVFIGYMMTPEGYGAVWADGTTLVRRERDPNAKPTPDAPDIGPAVTWIPMAFPPTYPRATAPVRDRGDGLNVPSHLLDEALPSRAD